MREGVGYLNHAVVGGPGGGVNSYLLATTQRPHTPSVSAWDSHLQRMITRQSETETVSYPNYIIYITEDNISVQGACMQQSVTLLKHTLSGHWLTASLALLHLTAGN